MLAAEIRTSNCCYTPPKVAARHDHQDDRSKVVELHSAQYLWSPLSTCGLDFKLHDYMLKHRFEVRVFGNHLYDDLRETRGRAVKSRLHEVR